MKSKKASVKKAPKKALIKFRLTYRVYDVSNGRYTGFDLVHTFCAPCKEVALVESEDRITSSHVMYGRFAARGRSVDTFRPFLVEVVG